MQFRHLSLLFGAALAVAGAGARADDGPPPPTELTLERVLDTARQRSPGLLAARARVDEARSRQLSAAVWSANPELEAAAGPRFGNGDEDDSVDWSIGASQRLELGGKRHARVDAATARTEAAALNADDAERVALYAAASAYLDLLYLRHRAELAGRNRNVAADLDRVARRRAELGAAGRIEESLAAVALLGAEAEAARARARHAAAEVHLATLLGDPPQTRYALRDSLAAIAFAAAPAESSDNPGRADVLALRAEQRAAAADLAAARAARIPDIAVGAAWEREEERDIVQATLGVELPLLDRGQGRAAEAAARRQRLGLAAAAREREAEAERVAADAAAAVLGDAARSLDRAQPELLDRTLAMARRSYEAGDLPLPELLAIRREVAAAELDHAALLRAAAGAHIDRMAANGSWK